MESRKKIILYFRNKMLEYNECFQYLCDNITDGYVSQSVFNDSEVLDAIKSAKDEDYQEVVLVTNEIIGPFCDFNTVLLRMEERKPDIWGIAEYKGILMPGFVCLREKIMESLVYREFLDGCQNYEDFFNGVWKLAYQCKLRRDVYLNKSIIKDFVLQSFFLLQQGSPFILEKSIICSDYSRGGDENVGRTIEYIQNHTEYKINLLLSHMTKNYNVYDIKNALNCECIIDSVQIDGPGCNLKERKIGIIIHLYYEDLVETCFEYIRYIPEDCDVYVVVFPENTAQKSVECIEKYELKNCSIIRKENRGRDFSALLVASKELLMQYEYLCFIHDKKSHKNIPETAGISWLYSMWENTLKNDIYINNLVNYMEARPRLGLLVPPEPFQGDKIYNFGRTWGKNFTNTKILAEEMILDCKLSEDKPPIALSSVFWCKTASMKPLFTKRYSYEDFPEEPMDEDGTLSHALERILPYVAQSEGYYTGVVLEKKFAELRSCRFQQIITNVMLYLSNEHVGWNVQKPFEKQMPVYKYLYFCSQFKNIYIYGNTRYTQLCLEFMNKVNVHVESIVFPNGCDHGVEVNGVFIKNLYEIENEKEVSGIIIAKPEAEAEEDINCLRQMGFNNLICFECCI